MLLFGCFFLLRAPVASTFPYYTLSRRPTCLSCLEYPGTKLVLLNRIMRHIPWFLAAFSQDSFSGCPFCKLFHFFLFSISHFSRTTLERCLYNIVAGGFHAARSFRRSWWAKYMLLVYSTDDCIYISGGIDTSTSPAIMQPFLTATTVAPSSCNFLLFLLCAAYNRSA